MRSFSSLKSFCGLKRSTRLMIVAGVTVLCSHGAAQAALVDDWNGSQGMLISVDRQASTLPLFSISLDASRQAMNSYSFDVSATINTWTVNERYQPSFSAHRVDFALQPGQKDFVMLKPLEMRPEVSAKTLLDKMLVDGAITLNMMTW